MPDTPRPRDRDQLVNPDELGPAQPATVDQPDRDGNTSPLAPDARGEDNRLDDADAAETDKQRR